MWLVAGWRESQFPYILDRLRAPVWVYYCGLLLVWVNYCGLPWVSLGLYAFSCRSSQQNPLYPAPAPWSLPMSRAQRRHPVSQFYEDPYRKSQTCQVLI